ncbi:MAG: hypothetical protein Q9166_000408 [cf. Caloplaca sp. 2 TL-2023]
MVDDNYFRVREKENAKEWQINEEPGIHQGNTLDSYFNQYVDEDQSSESAGEDPTSPQAENTTTPFQPKRHPQLPNREPFQKIGPNSLPRKEVQKPTITFATKRDNAARVAFRQNKPPNVTFDMGRAIKAIEPNVSRIHRTLEEIGVRFGSFILPQRSLSQSELMIWGNEKQVDLSINELKQWRYAATTRASAKERPLSKENFASIRSLTGGHWAADERTARRDAVRQHYQKTPEKGQQFKYNGYFLWPNDEIRATDLFGPCCEALDPLRMEYKVHIAFDPGRSVFKVYSNASVQTVMEVIERIENTIKEYVARDDRPLTLYLIEPPSTALYRSEVQMVPGPLVGPSRTPSRIPDSCGKKLDPIDTVDWELEAKESAYKNRIRMCTAINTVLERIPFYRGHLRMRAQFGTFALVKFQWPPGVPSVPLGKFETDIQSAGTRGTLIRDLHLDRKAHDVLDRLHHATDLFQPISTDDESLADVLPQYTAMFYLRHPEKTEEMIQLEIDFKANTADTGFETSKALWLKGPKPDGVAQAPPLEIFNMRLHRFVAPFAGSQNDLTRFSGISWQLKISADNLVDLSRITPRMEDFANGVRFKTPPPDENPAISGYKVFSNSSNIPILGMEQKTSFRYCLKAQPKFIFEISRYDTYDEYNAVNPRLPNSTQWAVSLFDREWDSKLIENARLGVGHSASWDPYDNPFFEAIDPCQSREPDAGFKDFLVHAQAIGNLLDGLKATSQEPVVASNELSEAGNGIPSASGENEQESLF